MNLREAFEEWASTRLMSIEEDTGWQAFQAGAAHAARECESKARRLMIGPMERAQFATASDLVSAIREAFTEAFK